MTDTPKKRAPIHPKVAAATLGAAVSALVVGALARRGIVLSPEEAGAVTTLAAFGFGYLKSA